MKDKIIEFFKTKGHIVLAAVCLVAVAVISLTLIGASSNKDTPIISYSTAVLNSGNDGSSTVDIEGSQNNESTDASKPIKDNGSGSESDKKEDNQVGEIKIIKPLDGEIIAEFAGKKLVYNTTMQEWRTHKGIDIKGDLNCEIKAAADGKVTAIKNDPKYGLTIVLNHSVNGHNFSTIYCGLESIGDKIVEGATVKANDIIATLGDDIFCEKAQGAHLHFELVENDLHLNPADYWK